MTRLLGSPPLNKSEPAAMSNEQHAAILEQRCIGCHTNLNETGQRWITNDMVKGGVLEDYLSDFSKKTATEKGKAPTARELRPSCYCSRCSRSWLS